MEPKIILDLCGTQYERSIYLDHKGYPTVYINGRGYKVHVLVWEAVHGPKPTGHDIHHIDHDKGNYELSNLALVSHSDHGRIHAGWVREHGEWTKKPCSRCGHILPLDAFYYIRTRGIESSLCRRCQNEATAQRGANGKRREYKRDYYRRKYGKGVYVGDEYQPAHRWS